jgi:putative MFS transporter
LRPNWDTLPRVSAPTERNVEATRLTPYHGFLFFLLSTATFFDGFDASMMGMGSEHVRQGLDIAVEDWGFLYSVTRTGMILSFFFLLFADRFGRRLLMLITVVGFAVCTGATALAQDAFQFTMFQTLARIFLTAEYALAVIVAGEEFPARHRGRSIAILTSFSTIGVVVMSQVQPYFLLDAGSSNVFHSTVAGLIGTLQGWLGLPEDLSDWRTLFALGVLPLAIVLLLRIGMRETQRFEAANEARVAKPFWQDVREQFANARIPFQPQYRRRTLIVTLLWNCVHLVTAPAVAYWNIYARGELGFDSAQVGSIIFWSYIGGVGGHVVAAWMIERVGRRGTCAGFYIVAGIAIVGLFQTTSMVGQYFWHILTVGAFGAANTATHIYATELYPTEIRATGYGWTTNLFGRMMELIAPTMIGLLIPFLGISWAVSVVGFGPILGAALVLFYAPETKGMTLEEIQDELTTSPAR